MRKLVAFAATALTMLAASPPAVATPLAAGLEVSILLTEDFSPAYFPLFYTVGGGGMGGSTYTSSEMVGADFWSDRLSFDSLMLGANMFQIGDIEGTLNFGGAMFAFTISGGVSDIGTFILPAPVHFIPADQVTLTWTCPAACGVVLNGQLIDAHADTMFRFLTADAPSAAVPEPGVLVLALSALAMALLATMSKEIKIMLGKFTRRMDRLNHNARWSANLAKA